MAVLAFLSVCAVLAGWLAWHAGIQLGLVPVVVGVGGATLLDAAGLLWRARSADARSCRVAPSMPAGAEALSEIRWRMLQDTCAVSLLLVVALGGTTYLLLVVLALARTLMTR